MHLDGELFLPRWRAAAFAVNPLVAVHCVTTAIVNHKVAILFKAGLDLSCQELRHRCVLAAQVMRLHGLRPCPHNFLSAILTLDTRPHLVVSWPARHHLRQEWTGVATCVMCRTVPKAPSLEFACYDCQRQYFERGISQHEWPPSITPSVVLRFMRYTFSWTKQLCGQKRTRIRSNLYQSQYPKSFG